MSETDRERLYVLEPLQPRILLTATASIIKDAPEETDYTPAVDQTAQVDKGCDDAGAGAEDAAIDDSGDAEPDGIFYTLGAIRSIDGDAPAADDGSVEISPEGIVLDAEAHFRTLGGVADDGADAGDDNVVLNDAVDASADGEKPTDENAADDGEVIFYTMGAEAPANVEDALPDEVLYKNPDAVDENVVLDDAGSVDPQILEFSVQSAPAPVSAVVALATTTIAESPVTQPVSQNAAVAVPPATPAAGKVVEANPLLTKQDDLLAGDGGVLI